MIERQNHPAMGNIWTDENRFRIWLRIEVLAGRLAIRTQARHHRRTPLIEPSRRSVWTEEPRNRRQAS